MTDVQPRRENLVRAMAPGSLTVDGDGKSLFGHFARFNEWNLIDSVMEGRFLERIAPGAFTKTLGERTPKILFNHGKDPAIGDKVIASSRAFGEDEIGPTLDGELLDGLDPLLVSGLRAGQYGMSYRFSIPTGKDEWVRNAKPSAYNPDAVPERTIREAMVFEAGPVTWPADPGTNAGVRSLTDLYAFETLIADPERLAALIEAKQGKHSPPEPPDEGTPEVRAADPPPAPVIEAPETRPTGGSSDSRKESSVEFITRDEKAARVADLEVSIARRATEYPGVLPGDVQALDDAENTEHDELKRDIAAWDGRQARLASFAVNQPPTSGRFDSGSAPVFVKTRSADDIYNPDQLSGLGFRSVEERNQTLRDNAMRSLEGAKLAKGDMPDAIERLLDREDEMNEKGLPELASRMIVTGSPVYKRAFAKYLKTGSNMLFSPEEQRAAALAVVGTTTTGGYAVPYVFDPTIIRIGAYTAQNPFRSACRTVTITNGNNWRGVTVGAVTSAYAAEAAANSEQGPTFAQPTYTVQRAQAFATVSIETLEDRPDISGELTSVFAESKATLEENKFAVGAGTTVFPQGMFLDAAYTSVASATSSVTALLDMTVLEGALPLRFRANGAYFMNRSSLRQLQILDTTYRYFTGAGIQFPGNPQPNQIGSNGGGNTGLQLLGYPIWEVPSAVSTLTTSTAVVVAFVDPQTYIIVDRVGMNVEVIPNMLNGATPSFPTGERGIFAYWRNTARVLLADGGRQLKVT